MLTFHLTTPLARNDRIYIKNNKNRFFKTKHERSMSRRKQYGRCAMKLDAYRLVLPILKLKNYFLRYEGGPI